MNNSLPTRADMILKIEAMMGANESRESIAAWALSIIDDDTVDVSDARVWEVLKNLGGADLLGEDRHYLYANEDFADWKAELG